MSESLLEQDVVDFEDAETWGGDNELVEIGFEDNRIWGRIPLTRITSVFDPFEFPPWSDGQGVSKAGVEAALKEGRFERLPYSAYSLGPDWTDRQHEERIAWLVLNPATDPIEIEFSHPEDEAFSIDDGNHRLAAAIFRGDVDIPVQLGGYFCNSVKALGVICRSLQVVAPGNASAAEPAM